MTPPKAPSDKRPDRHYDFGRMNMWFALSALGLLATTLWMVFADYAQPWKRYQAEFRSLERQKLLAEAEDEKQRIGEEQMTQLQREIGQAEAQLSGQRSGIEELEDRIRELDTRYNVTDADWRKTKSLLDSRAFELDVALQHGDPGEVEEKRAEVLDLRQQLQEHNKARQEVTASREQVAAQLAQRRAAVTTAEEKLKALRSGLENLETRVAVLDKDVDYLLLNAPLLDFVQPTLKVEQVILPGLYHNINFTEISRVDRCVTCHVAANRPGFEDKVKVAVGGKVEERQVPQPFRTHPRLDVFVGDGSPHPYTRFGCTSCHGGLDRATEFARAGHSPSSEEQRKEWIAKYGWEPQPYLENPILPAGMTEAGCVNCHAGGGWTPGSQTQDTGRELIVRMGCNACHVVNYPAFAETRKPGPALTRIARKTTPEWAYKWIESPRSFHPTTWMPHFFYQENIKSKEDKERQAVEIAAIVSYLWDRSEKGQYPPAPTGDAGRGKQLFESIGCAGCHVLDAKAKRDDFFPVVNRLHGPNLVRTGSKVDRGWLYAWLKNPKQYFLDTSMPNLRLTDGEAADLTAYLLSSRDGRYENVKLPAVNATRRDELLREYLQNTFTVARSQERMQAMSAAERNVFLGQQTILKYGCFSCHDIEGFEDAKPIGTELTAEGSKPVHQFDFGHVHLPHNRADWVRTKILRPRIFDHGKEPVKTYNELLKMPDFGMSEREAQAVLANVLGFTKESVVATRKAGNGSRTAALVEGRKLITRYNCQGCHLIEGEGHAIKSMITDPAFLPPNLAAEGARVQGDWLFSYLHDPGQVKMRPWLTVRMPTFGFTDEQANSLIGYFNAREERSPFISPFPGHDTRSAAVGQAVFEMFQCAKCHPAGPVAPGGVTSAGDLAPSLLLAQDRLRWDWVPSWIKDPQEWVPGTRMPSFFPETKPGEYMSPVTAALASPTYAGYREAIARHFASEQEMNEYLGDVDKVSAALRDHIWILAGGSRQRTDGPTPATPAPATSLPGPVAAGGAGRR
jgi:cytochrome c2/archaellum component FlaC